LVDTPVRVDKWLWVARLAKTRAIAADGVRGGRVHVNGDAAKPSRQVRIGDQLTITRGQTRMTVVVKALADRRGPAAEAARLYEETDDSRRAREQSAAQRRLAEPRPIAGAGRPTKRDRRRYERTRGRTSR